MIGGRNETYWDIVICMIVVLLSQNLYQFMVVRRYCSMEQSFYVLNCEILNALYKRIISNDRRSIYRNV